MALNPTHPDTRACMRMRRARGACRHRSSSSLLPHVPVPPCSALDSCQWQPLPFAVHCLRLMEAPRDAPIAGTRAEGSGPWETGVCACVSLCARLLVLLAICPPSAPARCVLSVCPLAALCLPSSPYPPRRCVCT